MLMAKSEVNNNRENLLLISVPLVMAASSVAGIAIGPLRHTGLLWILTFLIGAILIPLRGFRKITFPWLGWLPFYLFFGLSLFWSEMDWRNNIQIYIQMTVFPIVGVIASYTIRSEEEMAKYNGLFIFSTLLIGVFCVFFTFGPGQAIRSTHGSLYEGFADRPAATSLIVIASLFVAQFHRLPKTSVAMWSLCLGICILSASRMATIVILMLWLIHPQLASMKTRLVLTALVIAVGLAAFNTPIIQDRFFKKKYGFSGSGTIQDVLAGKFDSAGRFNAWPIIIAKSEEAPWIGHGVGQSAPFIYRVWAPMDKPHNEYLKTLYEGGYMGLCFFLVGLCSASANIVWNLYRSGRENWVTSAAFMGWAGFILMALVDNPLVYGNNFLHSVFFFVGAANGVTERMLSLRPDPQSHQAASSFNEPLAVENSVVAPIHFR